MEACGSPSSVSLQHHSSDSLLESSAFATPAPQASRAIAGDLQTFDIDGPGPPFSLAIPAPCRVVVVAKSSTCNLEVCGAPSRLRCQRRTAGASSNHNTTYARTGKAAVRRGKMRSHGTPELSPQQAVLHHFLALLHEEYWTSLDAGQPAMATGLPRTTTGADICEKIKSPW
jgi:hypothetical protein